MSIRNEASSQIDRTLRRVIVGLIYVVVGLSLLIASASIGRAADTGDEVDALIARYQELRGYGGATSHAADSHQAQH